MENNQNNQGGYPANQNEEVNANNEADYSLPTDELNPNTPNDGRQRPDTIVDRGQSQEQDRTPELDDVEEDSTLEEEDNAERRPE